MDEDSVFTTMRSVKDPIHNYITFTTDIWKFIDTKQYQRLREIKQLGISYYVWPGASHNRFEHGIGVAHLAGQLVKRLQQFQPELGITDRDVRCVQLAGLCHDLGHGPWSHVWDGLFIPSIMPGSKWTHEDASEMMFDDLVGSNDIDIDQDDVNFIKDLIQGKVRLSANKKNPPEKKFLFEIVANKRNGIDVDKFDYIARDVRAIGDHNNFTAQRLIESARVIGDEICYNIKDANLLYELCTLRFSNHKRIYSHKTARAIEYMIIDALKLAEPIMKIADRIQDPKKYLHLTDSIKARVEESDDPDLMEAQEILERIHIRDLYSCVDWYVGQYELYSHFKKEITPEVIVQAAKRMFLHGEAEVERMPCKEDVLSLKAEHVIVDILVLHHGMKDKNPLDFIHFYSKRNINKSFEATAGELSTLTPASFAEFQLRVFTKDKKYYGIVQSAYRQVFSACVESIPVDHFTDSSGLTPPITEGPSTPPARSQTPPGQSRKRSFSRSLSLASLPSPKTAPNKFTTVLPSYVPTSPLRGPTRLGPTKSFDAIPMLDGGRTLGAGARSLSVTAASGVFGAIRGPSDPMPSASQESQTSTLSASAMSVDEDLTTPKKRSATKDIGLGPAPGSTPSRRSSRKRANEDSEGTVGALSGKAKSTRIR